jgi:hypothetical protein
VVIVIVDDVGVDAFPRVIAVAHVDFVSATFIAVIDDVG